MPKLTKERWSNRVKVLTIDRTTKSQTAETVTKQLNDIELVEQVNLH
jgi:hypothetical protein